MRRDDDPMKHSARLARERDDVQRFKDAYIRLLSMHDAGEVVGLGTRVMVPGPDIADDALAQQRSEVARLAGAAGEVAMRHGAISYVNPPGTVTGLIPFNAILSWSDTFDDLSYTSLTSDHLLGITDQLLGKLDRERLTAEEQEGTLAGWIARFVRFPSEVRDAAGFDPRSRRGKATFWTVAIVQGAIGSIIAAIVIALCVFVFGLVF
jgi:hypothetical protein